MVTDKGVFEIARCSKDDVSESPDCFTKLYPCSGCLKNGTRVTTNRLDKPLVNRYRKVPVEIEAAGPITKENIAEIAKWCRQDYSYAIFIKTLEGTMKAEMGDYVIKGVEGEFYPCKPKIFEKTYEEV